MLYVAGCLEQNGVQVQFIDINAENLSIEETVQRLRAFGPDFIGYTITTYLFFQTLSWIQAIKEQVPAPTILGGVHLSIYPKETLSYVDIDYAVTGEGEIALVELLDAMAAGQTPET